MCARYTLTAEDKEILKAHPLKGLEGYQPDPNIAITDKGLIITSDEPDRINTCTLTLYRIMQHQIGLPMIHGIFDLRK